MQTFNVLIISNIVGQRECIAQQLNQVVLNLCHAGADCSQAAFRLDESEWDLIVAPLNAPEITGLQLIDLLARRHNIACLLLLNTDDETLTSAVTAYARYKKVNVNVVASVQLVGVGTQTLFGMSPGYSTSALVAPLKQILTSIAPAECLPQVVAYFQPQYQVATGALYGAEALARWQSPTHGLLGPSVLLPVFNTAYLRTLLWDRMLDLSLDILLAPGNRYLHIGVNVTTDVVTTAWAEHLSERLLASRLPTSSVTVEITEELSNLDDSTLAGAVGQLRLRGIACAIDDFGIGYSSLQRLSLIPFSRLKIDQAFVRHARVSSQGYKILANTIHMARDLGLSVTAEGVETEEDFERIMKLGCDIAQGYYFAEPMTAMQFQECLTLSRQTIRPTNRHTVSQRERSIS